MIIIHIKQIIIMIVIVSHELFARALWFPLGANCVSSCLFSLKWMLLVLYETIGRGAKFVSMFAGFLQWKENQTNGSQIAIWLHRVAWSKPKKVKSIKASDRKQRPKHWYVIWTKVFKQTRFNEIETRKNTKFCYKMRAIAIRISNDVCFFKSPLWFKVCRLQLKLIIIVVVRQQQKVACKRLARDQNQ